MADKQALQMSLMRHPANDRAAVLAKAEVIIGNLQDRLNRQVEIISRLLAAVRPSEVAERGTVVLFKLPDEISFASLMQPEREYLEVESSTVDGEGRVIVTLRTKQ